MIALARLSDRPAIPHSFQEGIIFNSPLIWDITRFCILVTLHCRLTSNGIGAPGLQLLTGIVAAEIASFVSRIADTVRPVMAVRSPQAA
jgi:N-acyl-L-homoserine lactone synthetase